MPLGLLTLAANLEKYIAVQIYKPSIKLIKKEDYKDAAKDILKAKPDVIGFSTWCISYASSLLVAREIKRLKPEIPIIFGGPHASILPVETLQRFPFVDYILCGEADYSLTDFLSELRKSKPDFTKIAGLCYRNNSKGIVQNHINSGILKMDDLPDPAYHLISPPKVLKLDVGRGCPFRCTYCSTNNFFSKRYRVKSAERIVDEMKRAFERNNTLSFSFAHDMFCMDKTFVFDLCDRLIKLKAENGTTFNWTCSARIDCVSTDMLKKMKAAGCNAIFFGIESGSERIQKQIKKNLNITDAFEVANTCRELGIDMHASFILGFPEEIDDDINSTLNCALKLAVKGALVQSSELSLLPGTPIYNQYKDALKYDGNFSNFSSNFCGPEEIDLIIKHPDLFSSFYYLPADTLDRSEMICLNQIINYLSFFRNTLYLLSDKIESSFLKTNLYELFRNSYKNLGIKDENGNQNSVISEMVGYINKLISYNYVNINNPYLLDVFIYEAYLAVLKSTFSLWHFNRTGKKKINVSGDFLIKPNPTWKILTTNYKLENIIPTENQWNNQNGKSRKGEYKYLLIATSEKHHKRIKLSKREDFLFSLLTELYFSDFVKKVKAVLNKEDSLLWIKKMARWGILEIREIPNT